MRFYRVCSVLTHFWVKRDLTFLQYLIFSIFLDKYIAWTLNKGKATRQTFSMPEFDVQGQSFKFEKFRFSDDH